MRFIFISSFEESINDFRISPINLFCVLLPSNFTSLSSVAIFPELRFISTHLAVYDPVISFMSLYIYISCSSLFIVFFYFSAFLSYIYLLIIPCFFFEILHLVFYIFLFFYFTFSFGLSSLLFIFIISSINHFVTFIFFTFGIHFSAVSITASRISIHKSSGFFLSTCIYYSILNHFLTSTVYFVSMFSRSYF